VKVCLLKARGNQKPEAYRSNTLPYAYYKILHCIIAQGRPVLADHLTGTVLRITWKANPSRGCSGARYRRVREKQNTIMRAFA